MVSAGFLEAQSAYVHAHPLARHILANSVSARATPVMDWSNHCGPLKRELGGVIARAVDDVPSSQLAEHSVVDNIMAGISRRSAYAHAHPYERRMLGDQLTTRATPIMNWSNNMCARAGHVSRRDVEDVVARTVDDLEVSRLNRRSG